MYHNLASVQKATFLVISLGNVCPNKTVEYLARGAYTIAFYPDLHKSNNHLLLFFSFPHIYIVITTTIIIIVLPVQYDLEKYVVWIYC